MKASFYLLLGAGLLLVAMGAMAEQRLAALPLAVGGRVLVHTLDQGELAYEYSWPAVYFETAFIGDSLTLMFDDDQNNFQLIIDDAAPVLITKPGRQAYQVEKLSDTQHRVRLEKISETQWSSGRFLGFFSGGKPAALPRRKRRIEFIGDSYTVGYGNASGSRECDNSELFATTNSQLAFGPLTAKHFNADYRVNASSGFGVVRNYNGSNPEKSLLALYPFTLHSNNYIDYSRWRPQVIVIALGGNDFSTPLNPGEPWQSRQGLRDDFVNKYIEFVKALYQRDPEAYFLLLASDKFEGELVRQVARVVQGVRQQSPAAIGQLVFEDKQFDYRGCHWHPSLQDNKKFSQRLIKHIAKTMHW